MPNACVRTATEGQEASRCLSMLTRELFEKRRRSPEIPIGIMSINLLLKDYDLQKVRRETSDGGDGSSAVNRAEKAKVGSRGAETR